MVKFSVIIPAYNEEKLLPKCLASLVDLDYDKSEYEIILVNNNSQDKTKQIALGFNGVKVVDEPKQGNVFALIKGCQAARGEVLAFTDADTQVPKDWLKKFAKAYEDKKVVCVGGPGKHRPVILGSILPELVIYFGGWLFKLSSCFNISVRKSVYNKLGGFDPKINFHQDVYLATQAKKHGQFKFLLNNPVITSSRRYGNPRGVIYVLKSAVNLLSLFLFKKTVFFEFGNVRK